jgi:hypothetical protein
MAGTRVALDDGHVPAARAQALGRRRKPAMPAPSTMRAAPAPAARAGAACGWRNARTGRARPRTRSPASAAPPPAPASSRGRSGAHRGRHARQRPHEIRARVLQAVQAEQVDPCRQLASAASTGALIRSTVRPRSAWGMRWKPGCRWSQTAIRCRLRRTVRIGAPDVGQHAQVGPVAVARIEDGVTRAGVPVLAVVHGLGIRFASCGRVRWRHRQRGRDRPPCRCPAYRHTRWSSRRT